MGDLKVIVLYDTYAWVSYATAAQLNNAIALKLGLWAMTIQRPYSTCWGHICWCVRF